MKTIWEEEGEWKMTSSLSVTSFVQIAEKKKKRWVIINILFLFSVKTKVLSEFQSYDTAVNYSLFQENFEVQLQNQNQDQC
jgi:hypothetical protein